MKCGPGTGEDPFAKVKKLFRENRLQSDPSSETNHKSYRDDELANTSEKKADLANQVVTHFCRF